VRVVSVWLALKGGHNLVGSHLGHLFLDFTMANACA
jgi:hypothetical protein